MILRTTVPLAIALLAFPATQTIPEAHCTSLAGTPVDLPSQLQGHTAILVVGFQRASQDSVRDWGKLLAADYRDSTTVLYYEIAMLASVPRLMRGFVIRSMKKDVSEPAQSHFLPVTDNEPQWRDLVHYNNPNDAYILLLSPDGSLRWQTSGPPTNAAYKELKQHIP